MKDESFISRWSRKKVEAREGIEQPPPQDPPPVPAPVQATPAEGQMPPEPLPPVESLTPESDFTPFMNPSVDPLTRQKALKRLFEDPRFNVMDGLDVYIDDYSKPDPLPEGWLEKMNQVARLGIFTDPREEERPPEAVSPSDTPDAGIENVAVSESKAVPAPKPESGGVSFVSKQGDKPASPGGTGVDNVGGAFRSPKPE